VRVGIILQTSQELNVRTGSGSDRVKISRVRKDTNMIATQYSTASEATGCRHSTRFKSSWDYRVPASGRFARGTVLGGDTNRMIHAQSPSFYPTATATRF